MKRQIVMAPGIRPIALSLSLRPEIFPPSCRVRTPKGDMNRPVLAHPRSRE